MACIAALALSQPSAFAGDSYDNCTGFIDSVPTTISSQGVWCLRKDLATRINSGAAITVTTHNVTLNCKGFKLGGLGAGEATLALGISALNRNNITVNQCNIRGFLSGVSLRGGGGGGHLVEGNRFDANWRQGIRVDGDGSVVRNNMIAMTGGSSDVTYGGIAEAIYVAEGDVDIIDNVIAGVVPGVGQFGGSSAVGIEFNSGSGTIRDNRIRGLAPDPAAHGYNSSAINVGFAGSVLIQDNHLVGSDGFGAGVSCYEPNRPVVLKDNTIDGFTSRDNDACSDGGGNLFFPAGS